MFETVDFVVDEGIALIRLNRPDRHNAINQKMHVELPQIWTRLNNDPGVRVAIITGAGCKAFCSGADISDLPMIDAQDPEGLASIRWTALQNRVWKPVICAVNGMTVGGGLHFIADSDIVIASETASFSDSHVNVGLVAGLEPISLTRRLPLEAVLRMALIGRDERMSARRALALGLISEIVDPQSLQDRAFEIARTIARSSPTAMARTKKAIWQSLEYPLAEGLRRAWQVIGLHNRGPDFEEGIAAFRDRRQPRWPEFDPTSLDD